MKKYIILSGSVDETTAQDDGAINAFNFGLVGTKACDTLEEAIAVRDQTIETDLEDFKDLWSEEDGYTFDIDNMSKGYADVVADKFIDVYYDGEIVNETRYKIEEI